MMRALAASILLFAATMARADPAPVPTPNPDAPSRAPATAAFCGQVKDDDGQERLNRSCLAALAFDPRTYFANGGDPDDAIGATGLVDAVRIGPFGGPRWAFAIGIVCPGDNNAPCSVEAQRLVMRAVTVDKVTRLPPEWTGRRPTTELEMRRYAEALLNWREADLRTCPGAQRLLLSLNDVSIGPFDGWTRIQIAGHLPHAIPADQTQEVVVTADGDSVTVRAGSVGNQIAVRDEGQPGGAGDWAERMLALAKPCLKPASVPAPWELPGR